MSGGACRITGAKRTDKPIFGRCVSSEGVLRMQAPLGSSDILGEGIAILLRINWEHEETSLPLKN